MNYATINVSINQLYLDPNNYRFIDNKMYVPVRDEDVQKKDIQDRTRKMIMGLGTDGISDLLISFKTNGFLMLEPIQVRNISNDSYLVIEGNRRVTTLKLLYEKLLNSEDVGVLTKEVFESIPVSVISSEDLQSQLITMGLHHIGGKKRWNPLNQCQLVEDLHRVYKMSTDDICDSLGLSKQFVNRCLRTIALIRVYKDSDYGEQFETAKYSFFEEALKNPKIRTWLEWSDLDMSCHNLANMERLFSWWSRVEVTDEDSIIYDEEDDNISYEDVKVLEPIITKSIEIRSLAEFIYDEPALNRMEQTRDINAGYNFSEHIGQSRVKNSIYAIEQDLKQLISNSSYISSKDSTKIIDIRQKLSKLLTGATYSPVSFTKQYFDNVINHFSKVDIKKYRGLENIELRNLSKINLFVGANNSGKTMALEAVYSLIQMNDLTMSLDMERFRSKVPATASMSWLMGGIVDYSEISGTFNDEDFSARIQKLNEESMDMDKTGYISTLECNAIVKKINMEYTMKLCLFQEKDPTQHYKQILHICPSAFTSPYRADRERLVDAHRTVVESGGMDELVGFIRDKFDSSISGIRLVDTEQGGRFIVSSTKHAKGLDLTKYGEGLIRVFEISLYIIASSGGCVFVDELDSGIHKNMLSPFVDFIYFLSNKYNVQLFISSHSKELIEALVKSEAMQENLTAYKLGRGDNDKIELSSLSGGRLKKLLDNFDLDIR